MAWEEILILCFQFKPAKYFTFNHQFIERIIPLNIWQMQMDKGGDICTPICSGKSKGLQSSENSRKIIFRRLHLEDNNLEVSNGDKDWWGACKSFISV